jgi:hypothetical protein
VVAVFHNKCAYCESILLHEKSVPFDHFRPINDAVGADGDLLPDGYWWLAYEWQNLYAVCE